MIKIVDPACGSGAFLNKALDYLVKKHEEISSHITHFGCNNWNLGELGKKSFEEWVLKNNIFGVDLSKESVEITKLSLWLKVVRFKEPLPNLDDNIKVGDSLIEDKTYSDDAFDWSCFSFASLEKAVDEGETSFASLEKGGGRRPEGLDQLKSNWRKIASEKNFFYDGSFLPYNPKLKELTAKLRKEMTLAEKKIWYEFLKDHDCRFVRQHPIDDYIVDFYSPSSHLVIEIDGDSHNEPEQAANDKVRDEVLSSTYGLTIMRILNENVLKNFEGVCEFIKEKMFKPPYPPSQGGLKMVNSQRGGMGFDIVIGNPPYVRQETIKKVKPALAKEYPDVYDSTADLYVYFYRRGFQLLKPGGILGFITSSTFTKTSFGSLLRKFLKEKTDMMQYMDFGDLDIWKNGITNYPCILIAKNEAPKTENKIAFFGVNEFPEDTTDPKSMVINSSKLDYDQQGLGVDSWNFDSFDVEALRKKIFSKGKPLKDVVGEFYRGILTGLNEAFIIDKSTRDRLIKEDTKTIEITKPFVKGEEIRQWYCNFRDSYLITIQKGLTREWAGNPIELDEKTAWEVFEKKYPAVSGYLKQFEKKAKKRDDQGEFWWELRACVYYKAFEEIKIIYPGLTSKPRFIFCEFPLYFSNDGYFFNYSNIYLITLLNSKVLWKVIKDTCIELRGGNWRYKLFTIYVESFPIVEPSGTEDDLKTPKGKLTSLARLCQDKAFERLRIRKQFVDFVGSEIRQFYKNVSTKPVFNDVSSGSDVNKFDTLTWDEFCGRAQNNAAYGRPFKEYTGSLKNKSSLKQYFEDTKALCANLSAQIHKAEDEINSIVYKLYDLIPDEIALIEDLTQGIYED